MNLTRPLSSTNVSDFIEKAGVLYGKMKIYDRAIRCLDKAMVQLNDLGTPDAKSRTQRYQDWVANFHLADGHFKKAADIFVELAQFEKAAKSYAKANLATLAAENYIKIGRRLEAERILAESTGSRGKVHAWPSGQRSR